VRFIPSFLVFDQPSQVDFPQVSLSALRKMGREGATPEELVDRDEDVKAVRKIYQVIAEETLRHEGRFQSFIFDHAGPGTWGGIQGINVVDTWREGRKLVPLEWIKGDRE